MMEAKRLREYAFPKVEVIELRKYSDLKKNEFNSCVYLDVEDAVAHLETEIERTNIPCEYLKDRIFLNDDGEQYEIVENTLSRQEFDELEEFEGF